MTTTIRKNSIASGFLTSGVIQRATLMQKMKKKSARKNIFITAPGGYGKTIAATQWLSSVRGAKAWLAISEADDDQSTFYRRLALALLELAGKKKQAQAMSYTGLTLYSLLDTLRLLPKEKVRCYLVLDDLHILKNEEIPDSLPLIAAHLPDYVRLCLISRAEPSESLLQTGLFEVFTKDDLLFTPQEIEWLCEEKDRSLTPAQVGKLYEKTGGWAMYIAALLSGNKVHSIVFDREAPQTLLQYLDTRVWRLWDDETKELLLHLALPSEIMPELCERLTGRGDGRGILEQLLKKDNAFLSRVGDDSYRFHDLFRGFLLERAEKYLGNEKVRRLNDIAAGWYYDQGYYFEGARHYIQNRDHEGVSRCMMATNRYHEESGSLSVEVSLNFTRQYIMNLPPEFIAENPYLISECAVVAFHNGDAGEFLRYTDMLYQRLPEIAEKHPDLAESVGFIGGLDYRMPLKEYAKKVAEMIPLIRGTVTPGTEARSNTITQNLPFFHRSMRDFSEYHELCEDDLKLLRDTFGVMIGEDYMIMEEALIAGIYYEHGDLIRAAQHAINGYYACAKKTQPETVFSAHMILAAVLYAMGASQDAGRVMNQMEAMIESKAGFLRPNFKSLQTEWAIRTGDIDVINQWLAVYANRTERLPFYQINRHFTTLRSYMAVKNYASAIDFGKRLQTLAAEYNRPLDQIESGLLTAIALWHNAEKNNALRMLEQSINTAIPYGFTRLFINEEREILPLLWELRERSKKTAPFTRFVDRLIDEIYARRDFGLVKESPPHLSAQQRAMLSYLEKGMSYNEIADTLGIKRATVKSHVLLLYKRLYVHNAKEAIAKAKMMGLLE